MKLSDVVSGSGLAWCAEAALLLFLLVFIGVAIRILFMRKETLVEVTNLPFDDGAEPPPRNGSE